MSGNMRFFHEIKEYIKQIIYAFAVVFLINTFLGLHLVLGESMQPNFETGQFLVSIRLPFLPDELDHGDVIAFHSPQDGADILIKRVIGLPGDVIEIRDTLVYVNGVMIDEPYINEPCNPRKCRDGVWHLGAHEYFVMGDNRNHSNDSRRFGPIKDGLIVSRAFVRLWPFAEFGIVEHIGVEDE